MAQVIGSHGLDANRWANQFCRQLAWTRRHDIPRAIGSRCSLHILGMRAWKTGHSFDKSKLLGAIPSLLRATLPTLPQPNTR